MFSNQNLKADDYEQISTNNKNLKQGLKESMNGIEIIPVFTEITPPGVSFPNLKITKPNIPFVKLVFGGWSIDCDRDYSSSTDNSEPSYFALEPDYKYLRNEYGLDLGSTWIDYFDIKIKGFASSNPVILGVESRTSAPIRILRNNYTSNILGIYPCGEGAGYAGGITSSAIDGMKVAEAIIEKYRGEL